MIRLENVETHFEKFSLRFPDVTFPKHKVSFVIGRNGTGKSTLLKAIAKLVPHEGTIDYEGFATYHFQEPILFNRSVYENIVYPIRIRKLPVDDYQDALHEYSRTLGIEELLDRPSKELSSGEKMKVSMLRSILFSPDILLLDEPTTHLDLPSIEQLTELIRKLKPSMTIVIVSHNQAFIDALQDQTYTLGGNHVYR
ncbi:MAG: ABC transporter ATP-binding protein [Bacillota bacterium]